MTVPPHEIIVVSGLPRSGTSMWMRMLGAGGVPLLTDGIRTADTDNPEGYFEYEPVRDLERNPDRSWLSGARGHAVKVISFLLKDLPSEYEYRVILARRDLSEVIQSQNRMIRRRGTDPVADDDDLRRIYQRHLNEVVALLERRSNFEFIEMEHRDAIADPASAAARLSGFLGGGLDVAAMASGVDPRLYRSRSGGS